MFRYQKLMVREKNRRDTAVEAFRLAAVAAAVAVVLRQGIEKRAIKSTRKMINGIKN
jgi:hypothetical protein